MKRFFVCLLAVMLLLSVSAGAKTLEFTIGSDKMYVSEAGVAALSLDAPAYIENGRTMVPVRVISENFGAEVGWNAEMRQVSIKKDGVEILLTIDSDKAIVNGAEKVLDSAAAIKNSRTMVPLRFISEELGRSVEYVPSTKQILISDEKAISEIAGVESRKYDYEFLKAYLIQTEISEEELIDAVPYLSSYNEEVVLMASKAKAAGMTLSADELAEINAAVMPDAENIYADMLVASVAKGLENYTYALNYINSLQFDVSEDEIIKMYNDNYVCAKHILISTIDDSGKPLSDKDKKLAKEKADYALKRLSRGDTFEMLIEEYGEDPGMKNYPDGYVFTKGEMVEEFENAVYGMKVGQTSAIIESVYGYHIIRRMPLPEISAETKYSFMQQMNQGEYEKLVMSLLSEANIKYNYTTEEIADLLK